MYFIKNLLINLAILLVLGIILFIAVPDLMKLVFEVWDGLFGPGIIILTIIVAALPRRRAR